MDGSWRLIVDQPADGATNMARDEALLLLHARGHTPPTLRLYRWSPACLSIGRFQRSAEVNFAACADQGIQVVRRPSGGRALLHDNELTYAIVAPVDHPLFGDASILASYRAIGHALVRGLQRLGLAAELAPSARRRSGNSAACFDAASAYELTVAGRKLAGSAQRRSGNALLQHGAIPITPHADRLAALLVRPPALAQRMITLQEALGRSVEVDQLAQALIAGFAEAWHCAFVVDGWRPEEHALAGDLRVTRYSHAEWTKSKYHGEKEVNDGRGRSPETYAAL